MQYTKILIGNRLVDQYLQKLEKNGIVPQVQLWIGQHHVGKSTFLSNHLFRSWCQKKPQQVLPCLRCVACRQLKQDQAMGLFWFDGQTFTMEQFRTVRAQAAETSLFNTPRALVITQAEQLSSHIWNAMLKLLEEPNSQMNVYLLVNDRDRLPATVLSRCAQIWFNPVTASELKLAFPGADAAVKAAHGLPGLVPYYQKRTKQLTAWQQLLQRRPIERLGQIQTVLSERAKRQDALQAIDDLETVLHQALMDTTVQPPAMISAFYQIAQARTYLIQAVQPKLVINNLLINITCTL